MGYRFQSAGVLSTAVATIAAGLFALAGPAEAATGPAGSPAGRPATGPATGHAAGHATSQATHKAAGTAAITSTALALTGFTSVVADSTHHQVFVSGNGTTDPVAVTDFTGKPLTTLPSLADASALALAKDDTILYAAISGTDEIAAVNTATLQEVAVYFTGTGHNPVHLAVVGQNVWFSYGSGWSTGLGVLDPSALTVTTTTVPTQSTFYNAPYLASSPSAPNTLVVGDAGQSPSVIESFDVSTGTPAPIAKSNPWAQSDGCENLQQLAITANGSDVVSACGWPYHGSQLTLSGMTEDATYQTGPYSDAVAVSPADGTVAIGVDATSASVYVFTPGVSTAKATYQLSGFGVSGVAWDKSGAELFAITMPSGGPSGAPTLNVINAP